MIAPTNHLKIGTFVLAGLALLLTALFVFGGRRYLQPTTPYETYVSGDVEGLSVGSVVKYRGVQIGKVTHIGLSWNEYPESDPDTSLVVVVFDLNHPIAPPPKDHDVVRQLKSQIDRGLRARVKGQGITGTSFLSIEEVDPILNPALEIPWTPRNLYIPATPGQFSQMLSSIEQALRNIEKIDFNLLSQSIQKDLELLGQLLEQVHSADVAGIGGNVNELVTDLRATNTSLQLLLQETRGSLQSMDLGAISNELELLIQETRETLKRVQPAIGNIDTSPLNETMINARQATERLQEVITDLQQYPASFIWGQPPQPARSVQPDRRSTR